MQYRFAIVLFLLCLFGGVGEVSAQAQTAAEIKAKVLRVRDVVNVTKKHPGRVQLVRDSILPLRLTGSPEQVRSFEEWRTKLEKDLEGTTLTLGVMHARLSQVEEALAVKVTSKGGKDRTTPPPAVTKAPPIPKPAALCVPAHVAWARPSGYTGPQAIEVSNGVVRWRPLAEGFKGLDVREVRFVQVGGGSEVSARQSGDAWEADLASVAALGPVDVAFRTRTEDSRKWRGSEWGKQSNKLVWLPVSMHRYVVMTPMQDSYISAEGPTFAEVLRISDYTTEQAAYIQSNGLCPYNVGPYALDLSGAHGVTVRHEAGSMFMHVTSNQTASWPVRRIQ